LRYTRILVPGLAYALALGRQPWIDVAYWSLVVSSVSLGVYWLARVSQLRGLSPWWGLSFLGTPAVIIALDRLTTPDHARGFTVMVLACLARETGFLFCAAYCLWLLWRRQFTGVLVFTTAALPAVAWYAFTAASRCDHANERYEGEELRSILRSSPIWNGLRIKPRTCGARIEPSIISSL
jgi:hypothetical protein